MNQLHATTKVLFVLFFSTLFLASDAQSGKSNLELGVGAGIFVYQGDLTPDPLGSYRTLRPGIVVSAANILSSSFSVRLNLSLGSLRGNETKYEEPEYRKFRGFQFRTPVIEVSPQLVWNPFANNNAERGFSPYLFAGVGVGFLRIRRDYSGYDPTYFGDGNDISQRIALDEQERLPTVRILVPVGMGIRYNLSPAIAVQAETAYRFLSSDYLDGFSQAANPEKNDHYQVTSAGVILRWGNIKKGRNQLGCPVIKY